MSYILHLFWLNWPPRHQCAAEAWDRASSTSPSDSSNRHRTRPGVRAERRASPPTTGRLWCCTFQSSSAAEPSRHKCTRRGCRTRKCPPCCRTWSRTFPDTCARACPQSSRTSWLPACRIPDRLFWLGCSHQAIFTNLRRIK